MTDGYALLRAIELHPAEDTPRLAYADWLDENATSESDRSRAEFIRVQCELARTPPGDRKTELAVREHELLKAHQEQWLAAYPIRLRPVYARGFISLEIRGADLVKYGEKLAAVTPLSTVGLRRSSLDPTFATCPILRHVRDLNLRSCGLRNHHLQTLLASPHLVNLRVLDLSYNTIGSSGWEKLAVTTAFSALRVISLHSSGGKDRGFAAISEAPWFANLVGLYASYCGISDDAIVRLAAGPQARELRSLAVDDMTRSDAAARAILDSPHLTQLERLWFPVDSLGKRVRAALRARFGANLNLMSYQYD